MPSPAPSTSTVKSVAGLPHPRAHALRPGSAKEDQVRHFVVSRIEHISRRFVKKQGGTAPPGSGDVQGYKTMLELCKDLEGVINIIWLSGTPSLQVPFLLNIASEFNAWVTSFSASPIATFAILHKLDHCFASLLSGEDIETHESLPGFENGLRAGMSKTDMVRCRSLVEQGRIVIVDVMSKGVDEEESVQDEPSEDGEDESGPEGPGRAGEGFMVDDDEDLYMDVARVYENTLVKLGDALGDPGVGEVQMSAD
ncbi:hypothetical protein N658DRAFT_501681 [Parathielavia hyrcaniae]|uniref:Meiotic recombination protein DMC1 n=1 Tax=Parathielavia hyrcaniae TaxID=113614 RepID=A0AAN6SXD2_9PEZI|nr:hypothetical protein N658DRAFT_501681 [Parathielavia hyrcaniae]